MSAVISACGRYRYLLERNTNAPEANKDNGCVVWIMLNPSTADAELDDPTIRKCIGFTERWGYYSLRVVNLFAWRATNPRELIGMGEQAVGPENDHYIEQAFRGAALIVLAWGASPLARKRVENVRTMTTVAQIEGYVYGLIPALLALRYTKKTRAPEHPLYVPYAVTPVSWPE